MFPKSPDNFNAVEAYDEETQRILLGSILSLPGLYPSVRHLMPPQYFDDRLQSTVRFLASHYDSTGVLPTLPFLRTTTTLDLPELPAGSVNQTFLTAELQSFARHSAYTNLVLNGVDRLARGQFAEFDADFEAAKLVGAMDVAEPFATLWGDETHLVPPPVFAIKPWLVEDTVTCVFGPPGSYKSFFCLEAALCMATGRPFDGKPVKKQPVVYVAAEGQGGIAMRIDAWKEKHGVQLAHTDLLTITQPVNLLDAATVAQFIAYIKSVETKHGIKFAMLVIDTYSQCIAGGDENSAAIASLAAGHMIRMRRELGVTVLLVHHTGKDTSRGMRGSDALRGNTDGAVEITKLDGERRAEAYVGRAKDAPIGARIAFNLDIVPIPRLAGQDLSASLVCCFDAAGGTDLMAGQNLAERLIRSKMHRDLLATMKAGDSKPAGQAATSLGGHNNDTYKRKIADALPMNQAVEVKDVSGTVLGVLRRITDASRATNQWGLIVCESKSGEVRERVKVSLFDLN